MSLTFDNISDPEEKYFIKTVWQSVQKAEYGYIQFFTDFYEQKWMETIIKRYLGVSVLDKVTFYGGYVNANRQILGICSLYEKCEFPIVCLKITVKMGMGKSLTHRDFLGALLGLGLERSVIGDIVIKPFGAYIMVKQQLADYICMALTSIGKYQHLLIERVIDTTDIIDTPRVKLVEASVSGLRADAVFAAGFGISRTAVTKLFHANKAKCNGIMITSNTLLVEGDVGTLKGYGKIKLKKIGGKTKKNRTHISIEKYY